MDVTLVAVSQNLALSRPHATIKRTPFGGPNMTVDQVMRNISALPPLDQLRIVQAIWDRLPDELGTELSVEQRQELDRRWEEYQRDPSSALTEVEFREQMRILRRR